MAFLGMGKKEEGTPFPSTPPPYMAQPGYYQQQAPPAPPGMPPQAGPPPGMQQQAPGSAPRAAPSESNEEMIEAIVQEKWVKASKEINKLEDWKEEIDTKITQLSQQVVDLKGQIADIHKGVLGKISEYDENLSNVGTEIKAMEKVFSKVLPSLTDSVNKLQRYSSTPGRVAKKEPKSFRA